MSINTTTRWGGIIGTIQDNGDAEQGWLLGYDEDSFTFALASDGSDDGNGRLTYLDGTTPIETGRWYHVAGIYDGTTMRLYVNGLLQNVGTEATVTKGYIALQSEGAPIEFRNITLELLPE